MCEPSSRLPANGLSAGYIQMRSERNMTAKWLFFDIGSTLVDESACYEKR